MQNVECHEPTEVASEPGQALTAVATVALPARFVPPTDADSLADALVAGQLSEHTRRAYASDLAELIGVLEAWGLRLPEVTKDHLHAYRSWLAGEEVSGLIRKEKACALATVSRKISVCRQFFAEALDRGLISLNPAARLRGFSVSQESKTLGLTRTQAKELLETIGTGNLLDLRDRAMLSLMIRTGIRRMDVIQATVGALSQRDGHTVLRVIGKRKKERMIKIPVDVVRTLEVWREAIRPLRQEEATTPLFCGLARQGRKPHCRYIISRKGKSADFGEGDLENRRAPRAAGGDRRQHHTPLHPPYVHHAGTGWRRAAA